MDSQACKDCGGVFPLTREHFGQYKNERNGDIRIGFRTTCRSCMAARSARHARENPDQKREAARRRFERADALPTEVWGTYGQDLRLVLGDACRYCGTALHGAGELDHLTPIARGGTGARGNVTLACTPCNRAKLAKTLEEFLAWRRERGLDVSLVRVPWEQPDRPTSEHQRRRYS